jgi:hypothetical protein
MRRNKLDLEVRKDNFGLVLSNLKNLMIMIGSKSSEVKSVKIDFTRRHTHVILFYEPSSADKKLNF